VSDRPRVLVPQTIHPDAVALLAESCEVVCGPRGPEGMDLFDGIEACDAVLIRTAKLSGDTIRRGTRLRVIARHGVGVDNIDLAAATECGIPVVNTPEANAVSVAEHVIGTMIAAVRMIHEADAAVRRGEFSYRDGRTGIELSGKRLGVVGLGRVGSRVARIARLGFDMVVAAYDPYAPRLLFEELGVEAAASVDELIAASDFVTLHVPLTPQTRNLIDARRIEAMKQGAVLVNCARGGLVDEAALARALVSGKLRAAAVDVFDDEPPPPDHPLFGVPNVLLTPHMAAHTQEAMWRMAMGAATRILEVLAGKAPRDVVNPDYMRFRRSG